MPAQDDRADDGAQQAWSAQTRGSPQEYKVWKYLTGSLHMQQGVDFSFQADRLGGLSHVGNAKIHFIVPLAKVAMRVQGQLWPTLSRSQLANDILQKLIWEGRGWFVADLLSAEVDANVRRVVSLALDLKDSPAAEAVLR